MKHLRKVIIAVLLLLYALPLSTSLAVDYNSANNENELDIIASYYAMATVSEADERYSLPHRDVFINSLMPVGNTTLFGVQRVIEVSDNGFSYEIGYEVTTRGQVPVPAARAVTDYDNFEGRMEQEIATLQRDYSEATILANPTSKYNCHSFAWCETAEMYERWIPDADKFVRDVHSVIIMDEENAQIGDIVVYFDAPNHIAHSAVIQGITGTTIFCVSKWGASALLYHELEYVPDTYKLNGECVRLIVRRTQHTGSIGPTGGGQHTLSCTVCSNDFTTNCNYSYSYLGNDTHSGRCLVCDGTVPNGACEITVTNNGNGTHTRACSLCDNHYTVNCSLEYTNINSTRHSVSCTECGYYVNSQLCTLTYTSRGNKTHTVRCTKCQNTYTGNCSITYSYLSANQHRGSCNKCSYTHTASCYYETTYCGNSTLGDVHKKQCQTCGHVSGSATTACTFAYKGVGENKHVYRCTECLYIKSGPTACMFKSDNTCKFCGARKDSAVINGLEQEETA